VSDRYAAVRPRIITPFTAQEDFMATKAAKPVSKAAPAEQGCPAEGMQMPPEFKGPHPQVKGGPAPYLMVDGAAKAAEFYKRAFGAEEVRRHPLDDRGRTMHVHLYINGGSLMLSDCYPEHGHPWKEPQGFSLHLQVDDVDKWWDRAIKAGAEPRMPVQLMFWGDRYGQLRDPFGIVWSIATTPNK
jgi:PhnB protein